MTLSLYQPLCIEINIDFNLRSKFMICAPSVIT
nr:MAG TPA: hypothetical protein [Caudoviricetes sp.]